MEENFRTKISTVDDKGERVWVYPQKPKGKFHNYRSVVAIGLLIFLFAAPFIQVNGGPLFLFNVLERKFILFGITFWPQDFFLIVLGFIAAVIFIVLFTVVYGRLFCGWVCPQTIFMEMVFRKIEYLIEGDYTKQKKLAKQDWDAEKITKKSIKHMVFFIIAFLIGNLVVAYMIGVEELYKIVTEPLSEHVALFSTVVIFSVVFYWIFAWFREQVCIIACPYGRLQGAMLDKSSMVVVYDFLRGEPRGKLRKNKETRTEGDCIDCNQCVQVCPTGIDIRNGTQLECINCTACMDACDHIMDRIDKPRGLIRYDSEKGIEKGEGFKFNVRVWSYTVLLVVLIGAFVTLLATRDDIQASVLRSQGQLYQETKTGGYSNIYNIDIINKTTEELPVTLKLDGKPGGLQLIGQELVVPPQGAVKGVFMIELKTEDLEGMSTPIKIGVYNQEGELLTEEKTKFLGPGM